VDADGVEVPVVERLDATIEPPRAGWNSWTIAVWSTPRIGAAVPSATAPRSSSGESKRRIKAPLPPRFGLTMTGYSSSAAAGTISSMLLTTRLLGWGSPSLVIRVNCFAFERSRSNALGPLKNGTPSVSR